MEIIRPQRSQETYNPLLALTHSFRAKDGLRFSIRHAAVTIMFGIFFVLLTLIIPFLVKPVVMGFTGIGIVSPEIAEDIFLFICFTFVFLTGLYLWAVSESAMHREMFNLNENGFVFRFGKDEKTVFFTLLGCCAIWVLVSAMSNKLMSIANVINVVALKHSIIILVEVFILFITACLGAAGALTIYTGTPRILSVFIIIQYRTWRVCFTYMIFSFGYAAAITMLTFVLKGSSALHVLFGENSSEEILKFLMFSHSGIVSGILFFLGILVITFLAIPIWMGIGSYTVKHWASGNP